MAKDALEEAKRITSSKTFAEKYVDYIAEPVRFCFDYFQDTFTDDVIKVMESVRDNPITIARSSNGVGKSFASAKTALWFFSVYDDAQVYLTAAPPVENLKNILWGHILATIQKHPNAFTGLKVRTLAVYRDKNAESFIKGVAIPTSGTEHERESKFSGKHAPHILFIVDEGDAVPDEVYRGIESCMSGGMARLLIMFNPRSARGPVYEKEYKHQANVVQLSSFRHPNVITGTDIYPGAVTQQSVVRRINEWSRPLVEGEKITDECFEVPPFLIGRTATANDGKPYPPLIQGYRKVTDPSFSYMVLGEYPSMGANQLINQTLIDSARSRYDAYVAQFGERPPQGVSPTMGVDVCEFGTDYNVACFRYGGYVAPLIFWQNMDTDLIADRVLDMYIKYGCKIVNIDATGVGSSVAPGVTRRARKKGLDKVASIGVKVSEKPLPFIKAEQGEFYSIRDQLWWALRDWLEKDPGAMLPPDMMLLEDLKTPTYEQRESGKIKVIDKDTLRELLHRSPDRADALCLTFMPPMLAKIVRLFE